MNEFEIINNLRKIIENPTSLNLDDDVAYDPKKGLIITIDTYNEKIHYLNFDKPDLIIKKAIRSSISDLISKGVSPKCLLISFSGTKKNFSKKNIKLILKSIKSEQKKYQFSLIGGDTTKSIKSSFTICAYGYSKKIIKRNKCQLNDDIYITGNIGDSAIGLDFLKKKIKSTPYIEKYFIDKYFKPNLPFGFHSELHKFANSSMDVSDGLLIDLKNLVGKKKLSFILNCNLLPKSIFFKRLFKFKGKVKYKYLFDGDDYQILFTAKNEHRDKISKSSKKWNQKVTRIGAIVNKNNNCVLINNKIIKIKDYRGYIHNFK